MDIPFLGSDKQQEKDPTALDMENILLEEFRHNNVLMYQHRESINSLFNLYLTLAGVITSGIAIAAYAYDQDNNKNQNLLLAIAFVLVALCILSFAFYTLFRNLRQAYQDSLRAMDRIKEFYVAHFKQSAPHLVEAFYWRQNPRRHGLGGDSRVMNWTTRTVGSYSVGQAAWILLIFVLDHLLRVGHTLQMIQESAIKGGSAVLLFLIAFVSFPLLYRLFGNPPQVQDLPDM